MDLWTNWLPARLNAETGANYTRSRLLAIYRNSTLKTHNSTLRSQTALALLPVGIQQVIIGDLGAGESLGSGIRNNSSKISINKALGAAC